MASSDDRLLLTKLMRRSGIFYLRDHDLETAFTVGNFDMPIAELEVDSLAAMELCIAMEMELNIQILPQQLMECGMLSDLASRMSREARRA